MYSRKNVILFSTLVCLIVSIFLIKNGFLLDGFFFYASISSGIFGFGMSIYLMIKFFEISSKSDILEQKNDSYISIETLVEVHSQNENNIKNVYEEEFKSFFEKGMYLKFKEIAIKNKFIDKNCKWNYLLKDKVYFLLLIYKLKENDYFLSTFETKKFCNISNKFLEISINHSMFSKYNMVKDKGLLSEHIKYYNTEYAIFDYKNQHSIDLIESIE